MFERMLNFLRKPLQDKMGVRGWVVAELHGPDGKLKQRVEQHNLVTDEGDDYCAEAFYSATHLGESMGMKLSTVDTAVTKSGAGSYIAAGGDYVTGSNKPLDDSTPHAGDTDNVVQFRRLYAAGEGTHNTINRVALVIDSTGDNGDADATNTVAIALFTAQIAKGAQDTLTITWNITFLGA